MIIFQVSGSIAMSLGWLVIWINTFDPVSTLLPIVKKAPFLRIAVMAIGKLFCYTFSEIRSCINPFHNIVMLDGVP